MKRSIVSWNERIAIGSAHGRRLTRLVAARRLAGRRDATSWPTRAHVVATFDRTLKTSATCPVVVMKATPPEFPTLLYLGTGNLQCTFASVRISSVLYPTVLFALADGAGFLQH